MVFTAVIVTIQHRKTTANTEPPLPPFVLDFGHNCEAFAWCCPCSVLARWHKAGKVVAFHMHLYRDRKHEHLFIYFLSATYSFIFPIFSTSISVFNIPPLLILRVTHYFIFFLRSFSPLIPDFILA